MNLLYLNIYHHVIYIYASVTGVVFSLTDVIWPEGRFGKLFMYY